ncbi:Gfo/Idh/MocA family protein [Humidisolicoccus flavus]|uniref:Gfo/Idh/MocA family protein n=1 Tax=Humidisolicoccus flavus TaxID=3111414 RepID=UPI00324635FE
MTKQTVGVGLIGAGTISSQYLENLTSFPILDVRFIADLDVERARAQADAFGVAGAGTVEELLADPEIEIVVNLTIPAVHVQVGLQAIAAGKHVWGEKPLSLDRESGRELLEAAKAAGVRVASAPDTFLGAGLQTARRTIESGAIGTPLTAVSLFQVPGPESWHPSPEFLYAHGGGPMFDVGPYYLVTLFELFGPVAKVVAASSKSRETRVIGSGPKAGTEFPVEVPTHIGATLWFEGGTSAQCVFSFDSKKRRAGFVEISGTDATAVLPDPNVFDGDTEIWREESDTPELVHAEGSLWTRGVGVAEFAESIRAGRPERANGELAYHLIDVMVSLAESADEGRIVEVASSFTPSQPLDPSWDPAAPLSSQP